MAPVRWERGNLAGGIGVCEGTQQGTDGDSTVEADRNLPAPPSATVGGNARPDVGVRQDLGTETLDGISSNDSGNADYLLNAKWQFYEKAGFRFAASNPWSDIRISVGGTSDEHVTSYGGWLIVTKEHEALAVSLNGGYFHSDYGVGRGTRVQPERHLEFSALATYKVLENLTLGFDIGASTNPDKASSEMPAYALGGVIYSLNKNIDLSLGLKFGITKPKPDFSGIAGVTIKF